MSKKSQEQAIESDFHLCYRRVLTRPHSVGGDKSVDDAITSMCGRPKLSNTIAYLVCILRGNLVWFSTEFHFTSIDKPVSPFNQQVYLSVFISPSTALSGYAIYTQRLLNGIHMCQANGFKSQSLPSVQFWLTDEMSEKIRQSGCVDIDKTELVPIPSIRRV